MTFLTPWAGLIAAAVAVPALLLLYFLKLRRREEVVPSTVLWRKAIQDLQVNAPFQKLRRNLLLLLQMLVLAALALALSQPTVPFRPAAGAVTVLLIDRSASMATKDGDEKGTTRLDEAKRRAKALVDTLPSGGFGGMAGAGQAMVIAFDDRAEIVQTFTSDTQLLRRAIDTIQPSDRRTKLKLAYQLADAQGAMRAGAVGNFDDIRPPDVFVYSDGRVLDGDEVSIRSKVNYERLGNEKTRNVAIVSLSARRNYERPNEVQIFTRLTNSGPEAVTVDVQLSVDGKVSRVSRVMLPPERWTDAQRREAEAAAVASGTKGAGGGATPEEGFRARDAAEFTLDLPQAGVVSVEQMYKEGDGLASDDAASVIVPPPKALSVLLVTEGENPFLGKVVRSLGLRDPGQATPAEYEAKLPEGRDVIIFDNYRPKKLPTAGNFVYFGTLPNSLRLQARQIDGAVVVNPDTESVLDWRRDHPIVRGLALGKLFAQGTIELLPASESEVLVDGTRGPLVVLHREGRSTHLAVAFDPLSSNWPFLVSWPMFMHNTLQFLATSSDLNVRETYAPGTAPRLPRTALTALTSFTIKGPGVDTRITIPAAGDVTLPALERVGLYELSPPVPGFERLAVNLLDANESNTLPSVAPPGGIGTTVESTSSKARLELWWWLILAGAIPLLLVEWFVYTRRTHL